MRKIVLFQTPLWIIDYPHFNNHKNQFFTIVKRCLDLDKGVTKSNHGGYQSNNNLVDGGLYPELNPLFDFIGSTVANSIIKEDGLHDCNIYLASAWLNVNNTRNAINMPHIHEGAYSGVFYLKVPPGSGKIVFNDSSLGQTWEGYRFRNKQFRGLVNPNMSLNPTEGVLMIWHSYVQHLVTPNNHDEERISISFNIHLKDKKT